MSIDKEIYDHELWYCEICGHSFILPFDICEKCKNYVEPKRAEHSFGYYYEKSIEMYGEKNVNKALIELEVSKNPNFNPNTTEHNAATEYELRATRREMERMRQDREEEERKRQAEANIPRCPTCGSTDLEKISDLKKATHWLAFGLLSKTARSQFRCKKCGYKW